MPNDTPDWTSVTNPAALLTAPAGVSVPRDGVSHTVGIFTLPAGTGAVRIVNTPSSIRPTQVNVFGLTTNLDWAEFPTLGNQAPNAITYKVPAEVDPTVSVDVTLDAGGGSGVVWVSALPSVIVATPDAGQAGLTELAGHLTTNVSTVLTVKAEQGVTIGGRLATAHTDAVPAPWEAANQAPINLGLAVPGNSNVNLGVVPPAGQRIYLHGLMWQFTGTGTANGDFEDALGNAFCSWNDSIRGPFTMDFRGAPLAAGVGMRIHNATANGSQFLNGSLTYSIGP